jgi:hypothetical protein
MLNEYECEWIRRANYLEMQSIPWIAKEGFCHQAIAKTLFDPLHYRCVYLDDVLCCLHRLSETKPASPPRASEHPDQFTRPDPHALRFFPAGPSRYEQLLRLSW